MSENASVDHRVEGESSGALPPTAHGLLMERGQRCGEGTGSECHTEGKVEPRPSEPPEGTVTSGGIFEDVQKGLRQTRLGQTRDGPEAHVLRSTMLVLTRPKFRGSLLSFVLTF